MMKYFYIPCTFKKKFSLHYQNMFEKIFMIPKIFVQYTMTEVQQTFYFFMMSVTIIVMQSG